jgi:hypothetical protein
LVQLLQGCGTVRLQQGMQGQHRAMRAIETPVIRCMIQQYSHGNTSQEGHLAL